MFTKKNSIILGTLIIIVIAVVIIIAKGFSIRPVNIDGMTGGTAQNQSDVEVDMEELAVQYQKNLKDLLPRYEAMLAKEGNAGEISGLRDELLALKMPAQYRDAHARLILLLDALADGIEPVQARAEFAELTRSYAWLNADTEYAQ